MTNLLMISGDRRLVAGEQGAFFETLSELRHFFSRIDILCPRAQVTRRVSSLFGNVYLHPATGGLLSQPRFIAKQGRALIRAHGHAVMTVHDYPPFYNGLGARRLMKKTGVPAVLELHHLVGWPRPATMSERIGAWMSKAFLPSHCRHFAAVRVVNSSVKNRLSAWGTDVSHVSVVPSVYLDHAAIEAAMHTPKSHDIVFFGRFAENKGLPAIIDAVSRLKPTTTLLLVGDGPMKSAVLERVRAYGMEDRVTMTGWLSSHEETLRAVASARICIMNSTSEGGPRSAVEAMALGLPIIATPVGLMPELLRNGGEGYLTDGTAQDIALKTETLLEDSAKRTAMGREGMKVTEKFEKKFAIKTYAEFLLSVARP